MKYHDSDDAVTNGSRPVRDLNLRIWNLDDLTMLSIIWRTHLSATLRNKVLLGTLTGIDELPFFRVIRPSIVEGT